MRQELSTNPISVMLLFVQRFQVVSGGRFFMFFIKAHYENIMYTCGGEGIIIANY